MFIYIKTIFLRIKTSLLKSTILISRPLWFIMQALILSSMLTDCGKISLPLGAAFLSYKYSLLFSNFFFKRNKSIIKVFSLDLPICNIEDHVNKSFTITTILQQRFWILKFLPDVGSFLFVVSLEKKYLKLSSEFNAFKLFHLKTNFFVRITNIGKENIKE